MRQRRSRKWIAIALSAQAVVVAAIGSSLLASVPACKHECDGGVVPCPFVILGPACGDRGREYCLGLDGLPLQAEVTKLYDERYTVMKYNSETGENLEARNNWVQEKGSLPCWDFVDCNWDTEANRCGQSSTTNIENKMTYRTWLCPSI